MTEEQVKKTILSLLTSSPQVATITTLQRDFKELVGGAIPFYKFNYNSAEHFFKSITDICTVTNSGPFAQVHPKISENSIHVNEMVTLQKKKSGTPRRRNPKQSGFPINRRPQFSGYNTPNYYAFSPNASTSHLSIRNYEFGGNHINFSTRVPSMSTPILKPPQNMTKSENSITTDQNMKNTNLSNSSTPKNSNEKSIIQPIENGYGGSKKVEETPKDNQTNNHSSHLGSTSVRQKLDQLIINQIKAGNVSKPTCGASTSGESLEHVQKWVNSNNNIIPDNAPKDISNYLHQSLDDSCTSRLISLDLNETKEITDTSNVPKKVQNNLQTLISKFAEGIWVSDLPDRYRQMFRRELAWLEYGYTSLIEMCVACGHIFHYVRPELGGDFKLYDRTKPLPANAEKKFTMASYGAGTKASPTFLDDPLPDLDFWDFKGRIPDDIFEYGHEIPKQFLPEGTRAENVFDVVVVEIYDPSKFWCYLGTSDTHSSLDEVMDRLKVFYGEPENAKRYSIPLGAIKEGLYCVQMIYGEYHRARVVKVYPDDNEHVRLLYIDYGTVCKNTVKGMCFLKSEFAETPAQAIRCRLANIKPVNKGHPWPRATSDRFRELINRRDTKIKISYIDWRAEYVCVFLADVTDPKVVYINELLVQERQAMWDDETQIAPFVLSNFTCKVQNLHLFPTFLELEHGMAPNAAEIYTLEEMLVPLQFCIPQYFDRNPEISSDVDSDLDEFESTFIETVKHRRKIIPWHKIDFRDVSRPSTTVNFSIFGEMKDEMIEFYNEFNGSNKVHSSEIHEDYFVDVEENSGESPQPRDPEYEPLKLFSETRKLSENIIQELEKYKYDELSLSDNESKSCTYDEVTQLVDSEYSNYNCGGRNNYKKLPITHRSISDLDLSTISERSENEKDSTVSPAPFRPFSTLNIDSVPEVNIFDNPEAFENSSDSVSPVTAQDFFKSLEDRLCPKNVGLGSDGREATTNSSISCSNPFKLDMLASDDPFDLFLKRCARNFLSVSVCDKKTEFGDIPDTVSELASLKEESDSSRSERLTDLKTTDLPLESEIKHTNINSLCITNPFWDALEDLKSLEGSGKTDIFEKSKLPEQPTRTEDIEQMDIFKSESQSDSDGSDYKVFVPKRKSLTSSDSKKNYASSNHSKPNSEELDYLKNSVATSNQGSGAKNMSVHAEVFVPLNMTYQLPYWPVPQYAQWSNGSNFPSSYQVVDPPAPLPQQPVRPPPGFSSIPAYAPKYQNYPPVHPQLNPYMAARMQSSMFPAHYQPMYYNRPSIQPQEKDFYDFINKKGGQRP
ncbi:uncharacterized protein LOC126734499 [Anthonomus grandis grandis]|uniref:uncharacterized protein LOC126734499 n=1 Tax=Anthonomus grandis grandis TaxID=2921223 RepID=UPI002166219E|nr:uncharacterized protein LOC126734499 [Anthonomus grandis grandis]